MNPDHTVTLPRTMSTCACLLAVALAFGGLAGCAPLQQAPLVYASKISVGVDVTTTSTESPGASLNVGYKQVDTAYVPVAVARECKKDTDATCKDKSFEIVPLSANNEGQDQNKPSEVALADAKHAVDLASAEVERRAVELQKAKDAADTANRALDTATKNQKDAAQALASASDAAKPSLQSSLDQANTSFQAAKTDAETKVAAQAVAQRATDAAQAKLGDASAAYAKLTQPSTQQSLLLRKDAFSVYGVFDSETKADGKTPNIGLGVGRTFSTGLASQNLTEGARAAGCLDAAAHLLEKASDKATTDTINALVALCQARTRP